MYRIGIVALSLAAALLLVAVKAKTNDLIPLFTIGVFVGFTLSQIGLVRHWSSERPAHWKLRAALNGTGAVMTTIAVFVFLGTKFLAGAWVVVVAIPVLMLLFHATERYYTEVARELKLGKTPPPPRKRQSVVIVPASTVNLLTQKARQRGAVARRDGGRGGRGGRRGGGRAGSGATGTTGRAACRSRC